MFSNFQSKLRTGFEYSIFTNCLLCSKVVIFLELMHHFCNESHGRVRLGIKLFAYSCISSLTLLLLIAMKLPFLCYRLSCTVMGLP